MPKSTISNGRIAISKVKIADAAFVKEVTKLPLASLPKQKYVIKTTDSFKPIGVATLENEEIRLYKTTGAVTTFAYKGDASASSIMEALEYYNF